MLSKIYSKYSPITFDFLISSHRY